MKSVTFASTNRNKYSEVQSILSNYNISVDFAKVEIEEIQSDLLEDIAKKKSKNAFAKVNRPLITEDDGLFIADLKGFPGQYSSHAFKTIGNAGILKLLEGSKNRSASFRSMIAYFDGRDSVVFEGKVEGRISEKITEGGWGYDPIFIPDGADASFGQLRERKSNYSHRGKALEKFAKWYANPAGIL